MTDKKFRSQLYEYDYRKRSIKLKNRTCPRCGSVMAFHATAKPRWHCGKCDYTVFIEERKK